METSTPAAFLVAAILLLCGTVAARAQVYWDNGAGTSVWNTANNWSPNGVPTSTTAITFDDTFVSTNQTISLAGATRQMGSVTFNSALDYTFNNTGTNRFQINNAGTNFVQNGSGDVVINSNSIYLTDGLTLAGTGTGTVTFNGNVTDNNKTDNLTMNGTFVLILNGTNNSQDGTVLNSGTIEFGSNVGSGGTIAVNGGAIRAGGGARTLANQLSLAGDFTVAGNNGLTLAGAANLNGGTRTINVTNTGATTFSGVMSNGGLVKVGAGTLTLSGINANTFAAGTAVNEGTLILGKTNGVNATGTGAVTIGDGSGLANSATLQLSAANQILDLAALTINADGRFDLNNHAETIGSVTGSGNITLGAGTLTIGANNTSTNFSGVISGTGNIVKTGTATLTLSGTNLFTGTTQIQAGTLVATSLGSLGAASSLGAPTTAANGTIRIGSGATGGTLRFTGLSTSTNRVIDLGGTSGGATLDASGSGPLVFTSAFTATGAGDKTLTLTGSSSGDNTIAGAIVNNTATNITSLVKSGSGTWVLSGANTYSGTTLISQGTLAIGAAAPSGAVGALGNSTSAVIVNDANTGSTNTALTIAAPVTVARAITVANAGSGTTTLGGAASLASGAASFTGNISLGRTTTLQAFGTSNVSFNGTITGAGGVTKTGTGTVTLAQANGFTGGVNVAAGTLQGTVTTGATLVGGFAALGNFSGLTVPTTVVTVQDGATLRVQSAYTGSASTASSADYQILSLTGAGFNGEGALRATGGVSSWLGSITLGGNTTITNTGVAGAGGDALYLGAWTTSNSALYLNLNNHALTLNGTGNIAITESIGNAAGDTGSVTLNGGSSSTRYTYAGLKNNYTGATTLNAGILRLQTNPGGAPGIETADTAVIGDLTIGSGAATTTATVQLAYSNQIANTANVTINSDGVLDLGTYGKTDVLGHLTLNGGTISLSGVSNNGTLYLGGVTAGADVDVIGGRLATISATSTAAAVDMNNNFGGPARTFNVGDASTLNVTARLLGGSLVKTGTGTMILAANSAAGYSGTTEVREGVLALQHADALGMIANGTLEAAQTIVSDNASLQLQSPSGNISFAAESLVLNGGGRGGAGALQNVSGNNTWTGAITLASDSAIKANVGTLLTVNGTVAGSAGTGGVQTLTIGGLGDTTVAGPISNGANGGVLSLTKADASTLTLANVNWFSGAVNVQAGTLASSTNNVFGAQTNAVAVASGATLALSGGSNTTTTIGSLTGAGVVSLAAATNLVVQNAGADTFDGRLTGVGATGGLFEKTGAGTFTFSSTSNTSAFNFNGEVQLDAGALEFQGGTSSNALFINTLELAGGTLVLSGAYINVGTLKITGNTVLDFGGGSASILNAANIFIGDGLTLTVRNWTSEVDFLFANTAFRRNNETGTLAVYNATGSAPENRVAFEGDPYSPDGSHTSWINNWSGYTNNEIRPVPEPATYGALMVGFSLVAVFFVRQRSRKFTGQGR